MINYKKLEKNISRIITNALCESVDIKALEDMYLGHTIHINFMQGEEDYIGREGQVTRVENTPGDHPQMHGTWGGLAVVFDVDDFEVID